MPARIAQLHGSSHASWLPTIPTRHTGSSARAATVCHTTCSQARSQGGSPKLEGSSGSSRDAGRVSGTVPIIEDCGNAWAASLVSYKKDGPQPAWSCMTCLFRYVTTLLRSAWLVLAQAVRGLYWVPLHCQFFSNLGLAATLSALVFPPERSSSRASPARPPAAVSCHSKPSPAFGWHPVGLTAPESTSSQQHDS